MTAIDQDIEINVRILGGFHVVAGGATRELVTKFPNMFMEKNGEQGEPTVVLADAYVLPGFGSITSYYTSVGELALLDNVRIRVSDGRGKYGRKYAYIRPAGECFNRSRRVNLDAISIMSCISKYYHESNFYAVGEGRHTIGAANERLALKEYARVCEVGGASGDVPIEKL